MGSAPCYTLQYTAMRKKIDLIDCFHGSKLYLEETSVLGFVCVGIYEWVCNIELYLKKSID